MSSKGIGVFISALTPQLIDQVVHLHRLDIPPETLRSDVGAMRVTQCATTEPSIIGAGVVHEVLRQSPWYKHVTVFSSTLEPSSAAVSVQLKHSRDREVPVNGSLRLHLSLIDLAGTGHPAQQLTVLLLARNAVAAASSPLDGGVQEGGSCLVALTCIATSSIAAMMKFVFQDIDILKVEIILNIMDIASVITSEKINDLTIAEISTKYLGIAVLHLAFFWLWLLVISLSFGAPGPW